MVVAQPDLGSGLVYLAIVITILFVAGTPWTHFAALGGVAAAAVAVVLVAAPAVGVTVLKDYQVDRLTAFINPSDNPQEEGYQLEQSITAIGAGQKTGRGAEDATQTRLDFLPEHHTDFVFAVVGEEFGFAGAAIVLSLFALLIWRALRIMTMSKNLYGSLLAGGICAMLMFQVFVNVGMTIGIMPITGVPLPLMSYGGSSVSRRGTSAIDTRAGTRDRRRQGPGDDHLRRGFSIEKESARHGRPWRNQSRHPRGGGQARG
jgi:rod shape determining protein RodA